MSDFVVMTEARCGACGAQAFGLWVNGTRQPFPVALPRSEAHEAVEYACWRSGCTGRVHAVLEPAPDTHRDAGTAR